MLRFAGLLALGGIIGAYFDAVLPGLLAATIVAVGYHTFMLLRLESELRRRSDITVGDDAGGWAQVLARINYLRQQVGTYKSRYRALLKQLRNSIDELPDGTVLFNEGGEILRYNKAARKLLGFKKRRDRGQRIDNFLRHPDFVEYLHGGANGAPLTLPSTVADDHWLSCKLVPYGPGLRLLIVRDISEQTRLVRLRRDFVANASHELRSPLTVLTGYLDTLAEDAAVPTDWAGPLTVMRDQAKRMEVVIADLLELSRLESGPPAGLELQVNVVDVLTEVHRECSRKPGLPGLILDLISNRLVLGNSAELRSVVTNLVDNAIRHTPESGSVTIGWHDTKAGGVELSVEDTGEGVAEADIPRLTERFFRAHRGRDRDSGGVGLGLAIVKHALGRHNAVLRIESQPGKGSRFSCHFPAARVCEPSGQNRRHISEAG